jgi:hypothetical protein
MDLSVIKCRCANNPWLAYIYTEGWGGDVDLASELHIHVWRWNVFKKHIGVNKRPTKLNGGHACAYTKHIGTQWKYKGLCEAYISRCMRKASIVWEISVMETYEMHAIHINTCWKIMIYCWSLIGYFVFDCKVRFTMAAPAINKCQKWKSLHSFMFKNMCQRFLVYHKLPSRGTHHPKIFPMHLALEMINNGRDSKKL